MIKKLNFTIELNGIGNKEIMDKLNEIVDWCNAHEKDHKEIVKSGPYDKEMKAWRKVADGIGHSASYAPEGYVEPEEVADNVINRVSNFKTTYREDILEVLKDYVITRKKDK